MCQPTSINRIFPPDLFTHVFDFLHAAETPPDQSHFEIPSEEQVISRCRRHPLLTAMLVCRAWYNLIQATPNYWTSVAIGVGGVIGWGSKLPQETQKESFAEMLDEVLERSGQLPIQVTVVPGRVLDFEIVSNALRKNARRLRTLSLLPWSNGQGERVPSDHIKDLLDNVFPALEQFIIGDLKISSHVQPASTADTFNLTAPELRQLTCERHLINPHSASHLNRLSLTKVWAPLPAGCVELPRLLDLHLFHCNPCEILPSLSTPALQTLIAFNESPRGRLRSRPPQYANLRELQWSDTGVEECFKEILELSPNLTRYSNYVFGKEDDLSLSDISEPATVLGIVSNNPEAKARYPLLKEVCLDVATGEEIDGLIATIPSIEFIRILRDPRELGSDDQKEREAKTLEELRRKVDWVVDRGSWRGGGTEAE
ncbi:hypothetical protein FRC04_011451 [Tulasnella sp. 424]|nr:hypothetical protein FRC04_011451 [Tulasnella sp. 424]KAG8971972.1 hypothetical protein FRC05_010507 [Tulasnella sp. 425]